MELGSIAEWIIGISKIIAIIGAITFPIIQQRKKEENSVKRLARREYVLIKEAISIHDKESYEQLESFNSMLAIVSDNQILVAISEKVGNILKKNIGNEDKNIELTKILYTLETTYNL